MLLLVSNLTALQSRQGHLLNNGFPKAEAPLMTYYVVKFADMLICLHHKF